MMKGITGNSPISHPLFGSTRALRQTGTNAVGAGQEQSAPAVTNGSDQRSDRAATIFRHEIALRLRIRFDALLQSVASRVAPYLDPSAPGQVAADVVTAARTLVEQSDGAPKDTLAAVRDAVSAASAGTREQSGVDDGLLGEAEQHIGAGLDALESDDRLMRAAAISVEALAEQRSVIRIRTQEGDVVRLDLRQVDRMTGTDIAVSADGIELRATDLEISSRSRLKLRVKGDLNDAELAAIRDVYATAEQLASEFYGGDMRAALEIAAALDYDSEQLARVSMRFKSVERMETTMAALQTSPQIAAAVEPDVKPVPSSAVPLTAQAAATGDVATAVPATPSVAEGSALSEVADGNADSAATAVYAEALPSGEEFLAGFGALVDYLSGLADYLDQTAARLADFAARIEPDAGLRLKFTQTTQLEILRSVMTVYRPIGDIVEPADVGDRLAQLDALVGDAADD